MFFPLEFVSNGMKPNLTGIHTIYTNIPYTYDAVWYHFQKYIPSEITICNLVKPYEIMDSPDVCYIIPIIDIPIYTHPQ